MIYIVWRTKLMVNITCFFFSMTSRADENDKWASYAGPGGWNGNSLVLPLFHGVIFLTFKKIVIQIK